MLKSLFGSKVREKLLTQLFSHTDQSFYVRELHELIHEDATNISRELKKLEELRIVVCQPMANIKYYRANADNPIFNELKSIVLKTNGVAGFLGSVLNRFREIQLAFIYGSIAKGKENANSDVDLLIVGNLNQDKLIDQIAQAEEKLQREINYIIYEPQEFQNKIHNQDGFIIDILAGEKILLIGNINDFGTARTKRIN